LEVIMKRAFGFALALLLFSSGLRAQSRVWAELEYYGDISGRYDEYPGPKSPVAGTAARVWGDLPIQYGILRVEGRLMEPWLLGASYRIGGIGSSTMNMKEMMGPSLVDISLRIDGSSAAWQVDTHWRALEGGPGGHSSLDLGLGWEGAHAVKQFYDAQASGVTQFAGNFGKFVIDYGGPFIDLRGQWEFSEGWALGGAALGSFWMNNSTEVSGRHLAKTLTDSTTGRRYKFEGGLTWFPLPAWDLAVGYRYEDVYFEPTVDGYSLEIWYVGPWVKAGWRY
jgi:hypothetical protein